MAHPNVPYPSVRRHGVRPSPCTMLVAHYVVDDTGATVVNPVPEHTLHRVPQDGKAYEIANLMYGSVPENLAQVQMLDPMQVADHVTNECVRRFGEYEAQRSELEKRLNTKKDE